MERETGVLVVNLGTPAAPEAGPVRRYLREFLSDPRVIDIAAPARWLLVNAVIAPFRAPRSAAQYRTIWGPDGSPLLANGRALAAALAAELGRGFRVALGMRYQQPSIESALDELCAADVSEIRVLPLFPQYASSSTGSALECVYRAAARRQNVPAIRSVADYHDDPGFIDALAELARPVLADFRPDHVLMSFHGVPERQIHKSDRSGRHCLRGECCARVGPENRSCYRAQCFSTSRALAAALGLAPGSFSLGFQSRLGRTPWIRPYTDELVVELAGRGIKRLAVTCPSFTADCLETIEEVGVRLREQWTTLGGDALALVPCLNAHPRWVAAAAALVR